MSNTLTNVERPNRKRFNAHMGMLYAGLVPHLLEYISVGVEDHFRENAEK